MLKDTFRAQSEEIVVDMFAGAGGASCGLEMVDIHVHAAINHDPVDVSLHARNHPETEHHVQDVYTLSPQWVTRGRRVGILWMSPDCTHHSKAKGGAPTRSVRRRELAMVLVDRWIPELGDRAPRVVILENVEEFAEWGPLDNKGRIIEAAKGERFRTFVRKLRSCGYRVDWRELRACDYGAPTIRKRLFMIARRDNQAIVWPEPTHGAPDSPGSSRRDAEAVADRRRVHRLVPPVPVDFRLVRGNYGAVWHPGCAAFGGKHAQAHSERRCPLCPEQPDTVHRELLRPAKRRTRISWMRH